jgi:ribosomal protein L37AE/L43A
MIRAIQFRVEFSQKDMDSKPRSPNPHRNPVQNEEVIMHEQKRPWHALVMVCPECGRLFRPEVIGLAVRRCPECEKKTAEGIWTTVSQLEL